MGNVVNIENKNKQNKQHKNKNKKQEIIIDKTLPSERPQTAPPNKMNNDYFPQNDEIKINASHPTTSSVIPERISSTLEHIVNQLTIVTQTLGVFEERLSMHEDRVARVEKMMASLLEKENNK